MTLNKLNFESKNLVVDYFTLNITGSVDVKPIAKYLFEQCHFNSTINNEGREEPIYYERKNHHKVSFRTLNYNPGQKLFWDGTQIIFTGENAAQFYRIIKAHQFEWNILNLKKTNVGRFDINYFLRDDQVNKDNLVQDFFVKSRDRAEAEGIVSTFDPKLLKIGNRKSPNHYRVYITQRTLKKSVYEERVYGLEFELEIKADKIKKFQHSLLSRSTQYIQKFENSLSHHFLQYSLNRLDQLE